MRGFSFVVVLTIALAALAGCGGGSNGSNKPSAFEQEVRGAMESIGDSIEGRERLREGQHLVDLAREALSLGAERRFENLVQAGEAKINASERLLKLVHFGHFSKRANQVALKRVEATGLIGNGCTQERSEWHCD